MCDDDSVILECASATFAGVGRSEADNEDGAWIDHARSRCALFDGLSGATGSGRFATTLAIESLAADPMDEGSSLDDTLRAAMRRASNAIYAAQGRWPYGSGFGCSAALFALDEVHAVIAHAGDVAALLVRGASGRRVTREHDLRWMLEREHDWALLKRLDELPRRVLCNMLGAKDSVIETTLEPVQRGDALVLFTATISSWIDDDALIALVASARDRGATSAQIADAIIAQTVDKQADLNCTALVCCVR